MSDDRRQVILWGGVMVLALLSITAFCWAMNGGDSTAREEEEEFGFESYVGSEQEEGSQRASDDRPGQPAQSVGQQGGEPQGRGDVDVDEAAAMSTGSDADESVEPEDRRRSSGPGEFGPVEWMAQPTDVDVDEIEERLDQGEMEQEFLLALRRDRQRSIDLAQASVTACYEELLDRNPETIRQGRIALEWTLRTDAGVGRLEAPQVLHNLGLDEADFEACILEGVAGQQFEAQGDGAELQVQWPAFLD